MTQAVSIMVAAHKEYEFPQDEGYLPVHVGRALSEKKLDITGDDSGENISQLNKSFCELTGLYWMWKNHKSDFYGLVHYRRYFRSVGADGITVAEKQVASSKELVELLEDNEILLSKPRNYWIESVRKHYENAHNASDLDVLQAVIAELHPDYSQAFEQVMSRTSVCLYNMFFMRAELFNNYCQWLFSILFEVEKRIPYQSYGPYQGRVFGFMAERLLNVWVEQNIATDKVKHLPVINLEGENLFKKAIGLLERKFKGVKQA